MANVLDENVIVLRFENQNFEKNVEASASALEKLNKSIEKSTSTKYRSICFCRPISLRTLSTKSENWTDKIAIFGSRINYFVRFM